MITSDGQDLPTVADLLAQARVAHLDYRRLGNQVSSKEAKQQAIIKARDLRQRAHDRDPEHTDPSWAEDKVPHGELVRFYEKALAGADG